MSSPLDVVTTSRCFLCGFDPSKSSLMSSLPPQAVIDSLSHSNDPPTPHAKNAVKDHLLRICRNIDTLDEAIKNLQQTRAKLEHERVKHLGLISPARSVPPEILAEVFRLYKDTWWEDMGKREFRIGWQLRERTTWEEEELERLGRSKDLSSWRIHPTRLVSQVCRDWRAAARACSNLWSGICFDSRSDCELISSQNLLSQHLTLSANQPLRVYFINSSPPHFPPLFQSLQQTQHRWSHLSLRYFQAIEPFLISPLSLPKFPSLVSLTFYLNSKSPRYRISAEDAPLLTEVNLFSEAARGIVVDFPWAQLHRLHMDFIDGGLVLNILQNLQAIRELHLTQIAAVDLSGVAQQVVCLPLLHRLKLSDAPFHEPFVSKILRTLTLPALRTLAWTYIRPGDETELIDLLRRSSPQNGCGELRELFLFNPQYTFCQSDSLDMDSPTTSPFSRLFSRLVQDLEVFHFECPSPSGFNLEEILDHLCRVLSEGPHRLHSFRVRGAIFHTLRIMDLLECAKEQGDIEFQLLDCAVDPEELHEATAVYDILDSLNRLNIPKLELDIEGPDHKRLVYTHKTGARIEEGCRCGSRARQ